LDEWRLEVDDVDIVGRKMFEKGNEKEESNDFIDGDDGNWEKFENMFGNEKRMEG
jgi:hypothetical protein